MKNKAFFKNLILLLFISIFQQTINDKNKTPQIKIGILSLQVTDYVQNLIKKRINKSHLKSFSFFFEEKDKKKQLRRFFSNFGNISLISKSYIDFLAEYDNTIIIPLNCYSDQELLKSQLQSLDGVLLTGGKNDFSEFDSNNQKIPTPYFQSVINIINEALKMNSEGRIFPVWGTCLGFESMIAVFNDISKMDWFDDKKSHHSIILTEKNGDIINNLTNSDYLVSSRGKLFQLYFNNSLSNFTKKDFYFNHVLGYSVENFLSNKKIKENFDIVAVSNKSDFEDGLNSGSNFISAVEHKKYPIYGIMFHPEKPLYDFKTNEYVRHDENSQRKSRIFSQFFIDEIRDGHIQNFYNGKIKHNQTLDAEEMEIISVKKIGKTSEVYFFKKF